MQGEPAILIPFFGMMLLTGIVWVYMYVRRLSYNFANRVHPQSLTTPEAVARLLPESVNNPSYNLKNLFELPVLFYAVCLYLYVAGGADAGHIFCAYAFLGLRIVHSAIHCTVNRVVPRFFVYIAAAIFLWVMVVRSALQLL